MKHELLINVLNDSRNLEYAQLVRYRHFPFWPSGLVQSFVATGGCMSKSILSESQQKNFPEITTSTSQVYWRTPLVVGTLNFEPLI